MAALMRYRLVFLATLTFALGLLAAAVRHFGPASAWAQTVISILVEGNQRVETEAILSYTQPAPGDPFAAETVDESVKALFQTGLCADVRVSARGSTVPVRVEEN